MRTVTVDVLTDPAHRVPTGPPGDRGLARLRSHVPRFTDGAEHARLRAVVDGVLAGLGPVPDDPEPVRALLRALGLDPALVPLVDVVAAAYPPHTPQSEAADDACDRLVAACGGPDDVAAARVCVLVQAHAATRAAVALAREGRGGPPVPATRRVGPDGEEVLVPLGDAPFGAGPHRCPGEGLAARLVEGALR